MPTPQQLARFSEPAAGASAAATGRGGAGAGVAGEVAAVVCEDLEACLRFSKETKFDDFAEWRSGLNRIRSNPKEMPPYRMEQGKSAVEVPIPTVRSTLSFHAKNVEQAIMLGKTWVGEGATQTLTKGSNIPCLVSKEINIGGEVFIERSFRYPHLKEATRHEGAMVANFEESVLLRTADGPSTLQVRNIHLIVHE